MPEKRSIEGEGLGAGDDHGRDDLGNSRRRVTRSLGMSDEEWASRDRRRKEFKAFMEAKREEAQKKADDNAGAAAQSQLQDPVPGSDKAYEKKPWESLTIGSLGENLSHIERKDREIEQQRFIVRHHQEHSPHQVEHNMRILNRLIGEREQMEGNEENNMPQIPYSNNFTLIYAGNIVDTCPTYRSFCTDREERLERYYSAYGPGWLWQEPALAGNASDGLAKKGVCLERDLLSDRYGIGAHPVTLEFKVQRDKVSRPLLPRIRLRRNGQRSSAGATFTLRVNTLLDSGASFPIILESDFARLNIDSAGYAAQGVMDLQVVGGAKLLRFYELLVSVCSEEGHPIVGAGNDAVWPQEPRKLGGFFPVLAIQDPRGPASYYHRLSGMVPFDACYMSLAPGTDKVWIGEDRRDVLGTSRLPAHLRYDSNKVFAIEYPKEIQRLREEAGTPDRVIFLHESPEDPDILLTDSDALGCRGRSELAIGHYQTDKREPRGQESSKMGRKVIPQQVIQIEPRKGNVKTLPKYNSRPWQRDFELPSRSPSP
ncbi:hypothetical protein F5Y17DRAFT_472544 [Xylariaceae sp. FL0594]|nr:hypothetical protein F5Y17DRAFT_472544 [Xylariaceae sp. FL0594]